MIFTNTLLLALIICSNGIMFIEGRAFLKKIEGNVKKPAVIDGIIINSGRYILEIEAEASSSTGGSPTPLTAAVNRISAERTDDYRPTDPGHSPGAGHSHGPGADGPN